MKRGEYIETREAKRLEKIKRFNKNVRLDINQELGTKNSLSIENKKFFRSEVKRILEEGNRRAFRSDYVEVASTIVLNEYTQKNIIL